MVYSHGGCLHQAVLQVHLFMHLGHLAVELLPLLLHHVITIWILDEEVLRVARAARMGLINLLRIIDSNAALHNKNYRGELYPINKKIPYRVNNIKYQKSSSPLPTME